MKALYSLSTQHLAHKSAQNFNTVLVVASIANLLRWEFADPSLKWPWAHILIPCSIISMILFFRKKKSVAVSLLLFWLSFSMAVYAIALTNIQLAQSLPIFSAFAGFKLMAIAVALIAPSPCRSGYVAISACAIVPILMFYTVLEPFHQKISVQEPALTVITIIIAAMILYYKNQSILIARNNIRLAAEKEILEKLAHTFLVMQDMTNTPLHIINLTAELLKAHNIDPEKAARYLEDSLKKLRQVGELVSEYNKDQYPKAEYQSLYRVTDPLEDFRKQLSELKNRLNSGIS